MSGIDSISIRSPGPKAPYNDAGVQQAIRDLLIAIGEDPDRDGLKNTPARVARGYAEFLGDCIKHPRKY